MPPAPRVREAVAAQPVAPGPPMPPGPAPRVREAVASQRRPSKFLKFREVAVKDIAVKADLLEPMTKAARGGVSGKQSGRNEQGRLSPTTLGTLSRQVDHVLELMADPAAYVFHVKVCLLYTSPSPRD